MTPATPEPEDFLTATLHHGNLQVDVTFTAYEARDTPGRFYLYEIYTDAAAFETLPGPGWQLLSRGQAPK